MSSCSAGSGESRSKDRKGGCSCWRFRPSNCEEKELVERARQEGAIPFDTPKIEVIKLNHRGSRCTFEAIVEDYEVSDPVLARPAQIIRATDVKGQESVAVEGIGLRSIAQGFADMGLSDEDRLARPFPVYDALYAYVQRQGK